jgi:hypothetical protein
MGLMLVMDTDGVGLPLTAFIFYIFPAFGRVSVNICASFLADRRSPPPLCANRKPAEMGNRTIGMVASVTP